MFFQMQTNTEVKLHSFEDTLLTCDVKVNLLRLKMTILGITSSTQQCNEISSSQEQVWAPLCNKTENPDKQRSLKAAGPKLVPSIQRLI